MNLIVGGGVMQFRKDAAIDYVHLCVRVTMPFNYVYWQYSVNFVRTVVDSGLNS